MGSEKLALVTDGELADFKRRLDAYGERPTSVYTTGEVDDWMWKHTPALISELLQRRRAAGETKTEVVDKGLELR